MGVPRVWGVPGVVHPLVVHRGTGPGAVPLQYLAVFHCSGLDFTVRDWILRDFSDFTGFSVKFSDFTGFSVKFSDFQ